LRETAPKAIHRREGGSRLETGSALGDTLPVNAAECVTGKRLTEARVVPDDAMDELSLLGRYPPARARDTDAAGTRSNPDFSGSGVGLGRRNPQIHRERMPQKRDGTGEPNRVVLHDPGVAVRVPDSNMPEDSQDRTSARLRIPAMAVQEIIQQAMPWTCRRIFSFWFGWDHVSKGKPSLADDLLAHFKKLF
jgi:hypothetical protein